MTMKRTLTVAGAVLIGVKVAGRVLRARQANAPRLTVVPPSQARDPEPGGRPAAHPRSLRARTQSLNQGLDPA